MKVDMLSISIAITIINIITLTPPATLIPSVQVTVMFELTGLNIWLSLCTQR